MTKEAADTTKAVIEVLGRPYTILCPEENREKLERSAEHLDKRMREVQSASNAISQDRDRIAVTAALNLAYDLISQNSDIEQEGNLLGEKVGQLVENIELTIKQNS